MDQTVWLIDENQRAPPVHESRLWFLSGGSRKQPGGNTMRLTEADTEAPRHRHGNCRDRLRPGPVSHYRVCGDSTRTLLPVSVVIA